MPNFFDKLRGKISGDHHEQRNVGDGPGMPVSQPRTHSNGPNVNPKISKVENGNGNSSVKGNEVPQKATEMPKPAAPWIEETSSNADHVALPAIDFKRQNASADLLRAQDDLHAALEKLETALQEANRPSSLFKPKVDSDGSRPRQQITSFTEMAKVLQASHEDAEESISTKVGHFMLAIYPVSKLVLGLTGSAASNAGFAPLQITANGLAQVLEVSSMDNVSHSFPSENNLREHGELLTLEHVHSSATNTVPPMGALFLSFLMFTQIYNIS